MVKVEKFLRGSQPHHHDLIIVAIRLMYNQNCEIGQICRNHLEIHVSVKAIILKLHFLRNGNKSEALERRERIFIRAMCSDSHADLVREGVDI